MKNILLIVCCFVGLSAYSQIYLEETTCNNVNIRYVTSNGYIGYFNGISIGGYYVPKNSNTFSIFSSALWLGGLDGSGQLHLAAQTYRQSGDDFTYGPYPSSSASFAWNKVWKIRKTMIDSFINHLYASVPAPIAQWPGNGNTSAGQAAQLAPYKDLNSNGVYEPNLGEYPCIKGDEVLYAIYNDDIPHTETQGLPLGVEVHQMIYSFNQPNDSAVWNTVFFNYKIINRSNNTYNPFYASIWSDIDIGYYKDDYIGTDVKRNLIFGYNGDSFDETAFGNNGYGDHLPAAGFAFLDFPLAPVNDGVDNNKNCSVDEPGETLSLRNSMYYNNNFGSALLATTNPTNAVHYWNYMQSLWKDNTPLKRNGQGYDTSAIIPAYLYIYPDSSDNQYGWGAGGNCPSPITFTNSWDEVTLGNTPDDRRILGTVGPMILPAGGEVCFTFVFIFAQEDSTHKNDNLYAVRLLKHRTDMIKNFFNANALGGCNCYIYASINEYQDLIDNIFPNPADNTINIVLKQNTLIQSAEISDISGKSVWLKHYSAFTDKMTINTHHLPNGYYILKLQTSLGENIHHPIIIQHQ